MNFSNRVLAARRPRSAALAALVAAGLMAFASPTPAAAHPLGNFTINRYDGLTLSPDRAVVDHVIDMAEIPALQERQRMDLDTDGTVSDGEGARWAVAACRAGASDLHLELDGARVPLQPTAVGVSFPVGQANLSTLRLVCAYEALFPALVGSTSVAFRDATFEGRSGWREITIAGDGVRLDGAEAFRHGRSERLSAYPNDLLSSPLAQASAAFTVNVGGPAAPAAAVVDAVPLDSPSSAIVTAHAAPAGLRAGAADLPSQISDIIQARDLTLPAIVLALLLAAGIGAVHAASPGHGKTLMAAYLVGTRGTMRHAVALGLTVTISHTIGVLVLGVIVLFAGALIPAERLFPILGLVSGLVVAALGLGILVQRRRQNRDALRAHTHDGQEHAHAGHGAHDEDDHAHHDDEAAGWHSHGLARHTHLPRAGDPLRWRNLGALGLVGGLVPSASAVLILVGSIAAARPAFGVVLTIAFGLGMAVVLVGVGVLLVRARGLLERWPRKEILAPLFARLPLATAFVFLVVGGAIAVQSGMQLS